MTTMMMMLMRISRPINSKAFLAFVTVTTTICFCFCFLECQAFIPSTSLSTLPVSPIINRRSVESSHKKSLQQRYFGSKQQQQQQPLLLPQKRTILLASDNNDNEHDGPTAISSSFLSFNPLYGTLWLTFLTYGIFFSPGSEMLSPTDAKLIENFITDPTNNNGVINPIFFVMFNALGIMPIVMAQLVLPQGNPQKGIWAAPFILGSFAAGYGALGLYLTLRPPPVQSKSKSQLSWITATVLENKVFNWMNVAACGLLILSSWGILSNVATAGGSAGDSWNLNASWDNYLQLASTSKLVSVSSVDLIILTVSAATVIPRDYTLRTTSEAESSKEKGIMVAYATLVLPVVGAALYCALRPPLPDSSSTDPTTTTSTTDLTVNTNSNRRRRFLNSGSSAILLAIGSAFSTNGRSPANAAISQQEQHDKDNILIGYQRLQYLLDNWEKETTICGMGGDKLERSCERTPLKVMQYLGYKATDDPLFKAEKTLQRLYLLAPANRDVEFLEAVDRYVENADEASSMAYISSWGEANPGGGKDRVELFIERARKNVIVARDSLATIIEILGL
jgi:hypothetical protein